MADRGSVLNIDFLGYLVLTGLEFLYRQQQQGEQEEEEGSLAL